MTHVFHRYSLALLLSVLSLRCAPEDAAHPSEAPRSNATPVARHVTHEVPTYGARTSVTLPAQGSLFGASFLREPILQVSHDADADDDEALRDALEAVASGDWNDASALIEFAEERPASRWTPAVAMSLGDLAYRTGRFSDALTWWRKGWDDAKNLPGPEARAIANHCVAEYAKMNARVGRQDELRRVFAELEGRPIEGAAAATLENAREGLWAMENRPGVSFRCGPYALTNVLDVLDPTAHARVSPFLDRIKSPPEGFSLREVRDMAPRLGLDMQMVHRAAGSKPVVPSVVHWRVGHFAAIVGEQNGKLRIKDPTFGNETWISVATLDAEASGYFLVPSQELPAGYREVEGREADAIMGKGHSGLADLFETGLEDLMSGGDASDCAMATYSFHTLLASLSVSDTPIRYQVARGPEVAFRVTYNQREAGLPIAQDYSGFGSNWVSSWTSYLEDNPAAPAADVTVHQRGGGGAVFRSFSAATQSYAPHTQTNSVLRRLSANTYVREYADGAREYYEHFIGTTGATRRVFLSRVADPQGNQVALHYDGARPTRLMRIVDAIGLTTELSYERPGQPFLITAIRDPYNRRARFDYEVFDGVTRLVAITDPFEIRSSFGYDSAGGMTRLTTPYGTTTFALSPFKIGGRATLIRYVEATDPEGNKERIEYNLDGDATGMNIGYRNELKPDRTLIATSSDHDDRNSYFWNKQQMRLAPGDYEAAHVYHWLQPDEADSAMSILESEKAPLVGRVWYNYPGQTVPKIQGTLARPSKIGRVVVDETRQQLTQLTQLTYNERGNVTGVIDPVGRETKLVYADGGVDVREIWQRVASTGSDSDWALAKRIEYDATHTHLPSIVTDASGQQTKYGYNSFGQLKRVENPLHEVVEFDYETDATKPGFGKLIKLYGDVAGGETVYEYDAVDRVKRVLADGTYRDLEYDSLDRVRKVTYADGTFEQYDYESHSLVAERDRSGKWQRHEYDALRRPTLSKDDEGRTQQFEWCLCGKLKKLIDGNGNVTEWVRDLQGRITERKFADGKSYRFVYDYSGRNIKVTDPQGRTIKQAFTLDDQLANVDYAASNTPDVRLVYDPRFPRLSSRQDGIGLTSYAYHPLNGRTLGAGQLAWVDGPFQDDTQVFSYDALGRLEKQTVANDATRTVASRTETLKFDRFGRIESTIDDLGTTTYGYEGQSERLRSTAFPNGMSATYDYFPALSDYRPKTITHRAAGASASQISRFAYEYNLDGTISRWLTAQRGGGEETWAFSYDDVPQLIGVDRQRGQARTSERYAFDAAGNRVSLGTTAGQRIDEVNKLNQLTSSSGQGSTLVRGTIDELAKVTVDGVAADVRRDATGGYTFSRWVDVGPGQSSVSIEAVDGSGNRSARAFELESNAASAQYEYDDSGNVRFERGADGNVVREYRWDQENRLLSYLEGGRETQFAYDADSRRVRIRELEGGRELSNTTFVWCGDQVCQQRNAAGTLVQRIFLTHGFKEGAAKHFYTRDHLGSVREVVANDGTTIEAEYGYDAWGNLERSTGSLNGAAELYAGLFQHAGSGLYLTHRRLYDPRTGRWLSRDPISESGGMNLYAYGAGSPVNFTDPNGESPWGFAGAAAGAAYSLGSQLSNNGGNMSCVDWGEVGMFAVGGFMVGHMAGYAVRALANYARVARTVPQCFAAGTLVHTEYGLRPIEEIEEGDLVLSRNEETGEESLQPVVRTYETPDRPLVELTLESETGSIETIRATREHPFYIDEFGWLAAGELAPGLQLRSADGEVAAVAETRSLESKSVVYNLEVALNHTFFVGAAAVWVHNMCAQPAVSGAGNVPSNFANLASPQRTAHITVGDATGGGHMWPGAPGKTPFPQGWSGDKIMHHVSDIATDPGLQWVQQTGRAGSFFTRSGAPARFSVTGVRDGTQIKVIVEPAGEGIITAFPF